MIPVILIRGEITEDRIDTAELCLMEILESGARRVWLLIDSPGGAIRGGRRLTERILELRAQGVYFGAEILHAASAAATIALACDEREISGDGSFALHPRGNSNFEFTEFDGDGRLNRAFLPILRDGRDFEALTFRLLREAGVRLDASQSTRLAATNSLRLTPQECVNAGVVSRITV